MAIASPSFDKAVQHHRAGELDKAVALYRHVLRSSPRDVRCLQALASALMTQGQTEQAIETLRTAARTEEKTPGGTLGSRRMLAAALSRAGRPDDAIAAWREAATALVHPEPLLGLVHQLADARRSDEALEQARRLAAAHPGFWPGHYELGRLCERMGHVSEARGALQRVLAAQPNLAEANLLVARMDSGAGDHRAARERIESVAARLEGDPRQGPALIELGLVLDRMGDHSGAFDAARRGQQINFSALPPHARDPRLYEHVIDLALKLTREQVAAWPSSATTGTPSDGAGLRAPVFIVGFPRSGTTLLEQMLGAHPRLAVTDEAPILQRVREQLFAAHRPRGEYPTDLGAFTPSQVAACRGWYLDRARRWMGGSVPGAGGKRLVDKQPLNTLDLALVRLIFPESPVIFVARDPRDTVLSCFMQGFARGVPHLFSLEGAARLYGRTMEVWRHYQDVLGLKSMEIRYEQLARSPETELRRVLEFIGEPWDAAVLRHHEPDKRRYVTTPSYSDVASPAYTRAIGRWKKYGDQLAPVLPGLAPWIERFGDRG